ncbi:MAG: oxygen-independent coproporphyrinogen III oxidase [Sneathiella sp.]|nr:oxygen-independent coproporphyrinogen III oxidase [Sneathiella sp.]
MKADAGLKISQFVPRYTSYPTAPHFTGAIDGGVYEQWLQDLDPAKPLSLYLHVPFCQKMCWYCGCHTKIVARYDPVARYAKALRAEIGLLADRLPGKFQISHVHWGGGTPTMLSSGDFTEIMALIDKRFVFTRDAEKAIEIDPRAVNVKKISALAAAGINRASLGVQDFSLKVQEAINRVQSFELTKEVTENLRAAGIEKINFDLMYGLPRQTEADVLRTVDLSHKLLPDRIALFGYAHVPWMKTHMKLIRDEDLPDSGMRVSQAELAAERLQELGYCQIGLDHFAKANDTLSLALENGALNRNFQGYTTDTADALLGVGASSIGRLPMGYVQNTVPLQGYETAVLAGQFPISKGIAVSMDDRLRGQVIERLMCDLKVDLEASARQFGADSSYFSTELAELKPYENEGLVTFQEGLLTITPKGRILVRAVCAVFDSYLKQGLARHSKAV